MRHTRFGRERPHRRLDGRSAYDDRRLGVAEKISQLGFGIGGVQREIDAAGAQAAEVEKQRLGRLVDLHGDTFPFTHASLAEQPCITGALPLEIGVGEALTLCVVQEQASPVAREVSLEEGINILIFHALT